MCVNDGNWKGNSQIRLLASGSVCSQGGRQPEGRGKPGGGPRERWLGSHVHSQLLWHLGDHEHEPIVSGGPYFSVSQTHGLKYEHGACLCSCWIVSTSRRLQRWTYIYRV